MKNILVVNVNWLGDVVMSSPVFANLRRQYPKARISCLAVKRVVPILKSIPDIDDVMELKEGLLAFPWMVMMLKKRQFDQAFFLSKSRSRLLMTKWAGIPERVGYAKKGTERFLTHKVSDVDIQSMHRRDIYLHVLESYGIDISDRTTKLVSQAKSDQAQDMILIHVGANWDLKRWPLKNFQRLIQQLSMPVGFIGSQNEAALIARIKQELVKDVIDYSGRTNMEELLALLKGAKVLITADSGPMHAASSLGTPVIGLFGPTRDDLTGPCGSGRNVILRYDVGCNQQACYHLACEDNICMKSITVKDVLDAVEEIVHS